MNIIPQLNLSKHPRTCTLNSLVDCNNMMVDIEKGVLTNDNKLESIIDINKLNKIIWNKLYKPLDQDFEEYVDEIIYTLNYDDGFIIFAREINRDNMYLFDYNEKTNNISLVYDKQYSYNGGKITGTSTRNRNGDLIIVYSEYDGNNYSPIKTVNINNPLDDKYNALCPEVEIPTVNYSFYRSKWYKGENTFFIRFKINEYDYTQWFPLHMSIITSAEEIKLINDFNFFTSGDERNDPDNIYFSKNKISNSVIVDSNIELSDSSILLQFNDIKYYDYYQIGIITMMIDSSKAFKSFDINKNDKEWILSVNSVEESSIVELTSSYYNYYDVKEILNFKNKLFISNYNEKVENLQKFVDDNVALSVTKTERENINTSLIDSVIVDVSEYNYKLKYIFYDRLEYNYGGAQKKEDRDFVYIQMGNSFTDLLGDNWMCISWFPLYKVDTYCEGIPNANKILSITDETVIINKTYNSILEFDNTLVKIKEIGIIYGEYLPSTDSSNSPNIIDISDENIEIPLKDIYIAKGNNINHRPLYRIFANIDLSKEFNRRGTYEYDYNGIVFSSSNPLQYGIDYIKIELNGSEYQLTALNFSLKRNINHKEIHKEIGNYEINGEDFGYINYIKFSNNESIPITKKVYDRSLIPEGVYNIFIHFVDKYGIFTDGFKVNNYLCYDDSPFTVVNKYGKEIQQYDNPLIKINIDDSVNNIYKLVVKSLKIPDGYIGWFLSYEEYETNKLYTVFAQQIEEDSENTFRLFNLYCNELIYDDKISANINHLRELYSEYEIDVTEKIKILSNLEYENLGYGCCLRPLAELPLINGRWYNVYGKNVYYQSKYKTLIPISQVNYTNNISNDVVIEGNYNGVFTNFTILCVKQPFIYNANGDYQLTKISTKNETYRNIFSSGDTIFNLNGQVIGTEEVEDGFKNSLNPDDLIKVETISTCTNYFDELKNINIEPKVIFYPSGKPGMQIEFNDTHKVAQKGVYTDFQDYIDLYRYKYPRIGEMYPKKYINYDENVKTQFDKTIRRSNVIADESLENSWRVFEPDQYINIKENRGDIVKMSVIGNTLLIHTQSSIFQFDYNDRLTSNGDIVEVSQKDIFDTKYKELFNTELGMGGLKNKEAAIVGDFGYFWYCDDSKCFYVLTEKGPKDISTNINAWLNRAKINNVVIGDDKVRKRLIIKFEAQQKLMYLSYSYVTSTFVSFHTLDELTDKIKDFSYTKNNLYPRNVLGVYKYNSSIFVPKFKLAIINNMNFDDIKFVEQIQYIITKINNNDNNVLDIDYSSDPVGRNDGYLTPYSGDKLIISSEECITDVIDLQSNIDGKYNDNVGHNSKNNIPYYELGRWNFNKIIRKKDNDNKTSRIFGKYVISLFTFDRSNKETIEKESKVEFESFNIVLTKYRR